MKSVGCSRNVADHLLTYAAQHPVIPKASTAVQWKPEIRILLVTDTYAMGQWLLKQSVAIMQFRAVCSSAGIAV